MFSRILSRNFFSNELDNKISKVEAFFFCNWFLFRPKTNCRFCGCAWRHDVSGRRQSLSQRRWVRKRERETGHFQWYEYEWWMGNDEYECATGTGKKHTQNTQPVRCCCCCCGRQRFSGSRWTWWTTCTVFFYLWAASFTKIGATCHPPINFCRWIFIWMQKWFVSSFWEKIWNLAPTAATNQNFFKKCLKCLKWALERFQNISRQFTSLSVNTR